MLDTFFLKPFNLLSTLIFLLSNQKLLPLSPSNPKITTPSIFFIVKITRSTTEATSLIDLKFLTHRLFNSHTLNIDLPLGHLRSTHHEIIHRVGLNPL
ncbi:hypothetical protein GIB67_000093 [Kingdonia uniflora]|uniref:Uncharacterized protein n=1 Tax=Kingdonia uniflora TaxID=39325 RepID=A0A7J7M5Q6_9MAGN|nr:hypothetical protein GIB67_000093 [Kingdonia uniflora]